MSKGLNNLANVVNEMLVENKSNGLTLDKSSNILLSNVDKLYRDWENGWWKLKNN